jgi:hypothetical protein
MKTVSFLLARLASDNTKSMIIAESIKKKVNVNINSKNGNLKRAKIPIIKLFFLSFIAAFKRINLLFVRFDVVPFFREVHCVNVERVSRPISV